jgi:hypothetical protein
MAGNWKNHYLAPIVILGSLSININLVIGDIINHWLLDRMGGEVVGGADRLVVSYCFYNTQM